MLIYNPIAVHDNAGFAFAQFSSFPLQSQVGPSLKERNDMPIRIYKYVGPRGWGEGRSSALNLPVCVSMKVMDMGLFLAPSE